MSLSQNIPLLCALLISLALNSDPAQAADTIYSGGVILTMDDRQPRAESVAVKDGKIVAVGKKDEVLRTKVDATKLVDLGGKTMLPGFVDAHGHLMGGGLQALSANLLAPPDGEVKNIASLQDVLRDWMAKNRQAVEKIKLVVGFGYDNAQLAELRHPRREELDAISEDIPIVLVHQSGHIISVNSVALELGGISAQSENPQGGVIQRREGGIEPNGVLEETAAFPLLIKLLGRVGPEGSGAFIQAGVDLWARFGYTTAQDGRTMPGALKSLKEAAARGDLKIDVASYPDVLVDREIIKKEYSPNYTDRFRVAGAKLTIDGSPQGFTAWRDRPYFKPVGDYPPGYSGYAAATPEQVGDAIDWVFDNDIQILTHSNGEAASDLLIAHIAAATKKHGGIDRRPVLIHGQFLRKDQVDSFKSLGVIPSLFPMHTFYWGDWHREHTVGPKLSNDISPTGWCVERGMKFTTHHDAPVALPNSMRVLDATVTRRSRSGDIIGPEHRVDVMTALKAMTIWPAWQHFEEETKGSIEIGKLADFVILDQDPTAVDPDRIDLIKVVETIKEDVTVFNLVEADKAGAGVEFRGRSELVFTRALGRIGASLGPKPVSSPILGPYDPLLQRGEPIQCSSCLCGAMSRLASAIGNGAPERRRQ